MCNRWPSLRDPDSAERKRALAGNERGRNLLHNHFTAITSISTNAPSGNPATAKAARAGL